MEQCSLEVLGSPSTSPFGCGSKGPHADPRRSAARCQPQIWWICRLTNVAHALVGARGADAAADAVAALEHNDIDAVTQQHGSRTQTGDACADHDDLFGVAGLRSWAASSA